ncbi:MAG: hypothetical protein M1838_000635 [Thelocarpon superellum]|nr:MAG: hypothetical protein M1838_000635 [Thelocarpon superellum]
MPPEGTFMHWFLNNKAIHIWITLGTLFSLAFYTTLDNFRRTSPFGDMLPAASEAMAHPIKATRATGEVLKLHTAYRAAETAEERKRKLDDADKRVQYREAHGLSREMGFEELTSASRRKTVGIRGTEHPVVEVEVEVGASAADGALDNSPVAPGSASDPESPRQVVGISSPDPSVSRSDVDGPKQPVKRWLGIW